MLYAKNADTVPKNRKRPSFWNRRFGNLTLAGKILRNLVELLVEDTRHLEGFGNVEVHDAFALHDDNAVALAVAEQLNCVVAHLACHNTVTERRGTAALYMAKDGRTALDAEIGRASCRERVFRAV